MCDAKLDSSQVLPVGDAEPHSLVELPVRNEEIHATREDLSSRGVFGRVREAGVEVVEVSFSSRGAVASMFPRLITIFSPVLYFLPLSRSRCLFPTTSSSMSPGALKGISQLKYIPFRVLLHYHSISLQIR